MFLLILCLPCKDSFYPCFNDRIVFYCINQYGNQIRKIVMETLKHLDVDNVRISVVDKGALDCTIKARVEGAVFRSVDQYEKLPWGGAIR